MTDTCVEPQATSLMISEQTRLEYLKVMGVQPWFPRDPLENALTHEALFLADAQSGSIAEPLHTSITTKSGQPDVLPSSEATPETQPSVSPTDAKAETVSSEPEVVDTQASLGLVEADCRFKLSIYTEVGEILCLADTPIEQDESLANEQFHLLENMLYAIGVKPGHIGCAHLNWPLMPAAHFKQGWEQAKGMCDTYLQPKLEADKYKAILILGQQSLQAMVGKDADLDTYNGQIKIDGLDLPIYATYPLTSLLRVPSLKQEAWSHIKSMRAIYLPQK